MLTSVGAPSAELERFPAEDHMAQRMLPADFRVVGVRLHQLIECRRCLIENGHALARHKAQEFRG
jgi:hypothetical protein